ncbi:unnamed protein product, partial [Cercopithifilaria johnstoni]
SCIKRSTNRDTVRLCSYKEHNCNMNGIDDTIRDYQERIWKGLVKRPPDLANLVEKTMQIFMNE